ncbi:MAG: hypothetical protein OEW39_09670 [Deltaproteobacteria bacterium]|nr:hypothetical protein [Deltaproteobacteria bacterium]
MAQWFKKQLPSLVIVLLLAACSSEEKVKAPLEEPPASSAESESAAPVETPGAPGSSKSPKNTIPGAAPKEKTAAEDPAVAAAKAEAREAAALRQAFGKPVGKSQSAPVPQEAASAEEGIPFDQAFPPPAPPPTVNIAVVGAVESPDKSQGVAYVIGTLQRERLERVIGKQVKIAYVSVALAIPTRTSRIRFRPDAVKAAVNIASAMTRPQVIEPMTEQEQAQDGVDIIIYVGPEYR